MAKSRNVAKVQSSEKTRMTDEHLSETCRGSYGWSAVKNPQIPLSGSKIPEKVIISLDITFKGKPEDGELSPSKSSRCSVRQKTEPEVGSSSSSQIDKGKKGKVATLKEEQRVEEDDVLDRI